MSDSLWPHGLYSPWNSPGQNTGVGSLSFLQRIFKPRSSTLQADSLPAEPQGKFKSTGVDNLSLLQWIFLTQEWNQGLLHCRWILYQLSYQGSHMFSEKLHMNSFLILFPIHSGRKNITMAVILALYVTWSFCTHYTRKKRRIIN